MESLPFCADRAVIHKTLEECKGSVDLAVSRFLDSEFQSSSSSRRGSSSVEREPDSDDDSFSGPKKKQDRRLSHAKRTSATDNVQRSGKYLTVRLKSPRLPSTKETLSASDSYNKPTAIKDEDETEEEDWLNSSPRKDSESASVSTSASEYSIASNPRSSGIRLKLSQPKKRDGNNVPWAAGPTSEFPLRSDPVNIPTGNVEQRDTSPKKRLISRNQRDMMQKKAQKAAAKERKREAAAARGTHHYNGPPIPTARKGKENTPVIETHIKVLYI